MPAPEVAVPPARGRLRRQRGATVVEFALIALLFFAFLFAVIELARMMFLFNTLQEVTRRAASAASVSDPTDATALTTIRRNAIFRTTQGSLAMMPELTDDAVRIDYLSLSRDNSGNYSMQTAAGANATSPSDNKRNCTIDPYAGNCVRLVRVRICDPLITTSCEAMKFRPMTTLFNFEMPLTTAPTIIKAQSFGLNPG